MIGVSGKRVSVKDIITEMQQELAEQGVKLKTPEGYYTQCAVVNPLKTKKGKVKTQKKPKKRRTRK